MLTRSRCLVGLTAALLSLTFSGVAEAQSGRIGRRLQRQLMNQGSYYMTGQPYYSPYQGGYAGYGSPGYGPQAGMMNNRQGPPFMGNRQGYSPYQQPGTNMYQQGWSNTPGTPRHDSQLQPTSYNAPAAQRYQIPSNYAGTPAGRVISYGGRNYLSGSDGTMTIYTGPVAQ